MKIAFDIGGVISKYPHTMIPMMATLALQHEVHVITDMHVRGDVEIMLLDNGVSPAVVPLDRIHTADYAKNGEACKAVLLRDLDIDILIDDFVGYVVWPFETPAPIRMLVMPDPRQPYWHPSWLVRGDSPEFGRRVFKGVEG